MIRLQHASDRISPYPEPATIMQTSHSTIFEGNKDGRWWINYNKHNPQGTEIKTYKMFT